jgi:N-acetylmuramic acid 6-phosphate etherase
MNSMTTEGRNPRSENIDTMSAIEIVDLIQMEDASVADAVGLVREPIAAAVEAIADSFRKGGRLFYLGAGTSGRLGVLDASECPPTFNTQPEMVVGIIAGGSEALTRAIEGAEDDGPQAIVDLQQHQFASRDVLVGIATSGRTPYVIEGVRHAKSLGATTVGLVCNSDSALHPMVDIMIAPIVGPEVVTGSTRMKAGTATKMVLNRLTTGAMILLGKTYGNLMVDLRATNSKLKDRSVRIVSEVTGLNHASAADLLTECQGEVKTAIVAWLGQVVPDEARTLLEESGGRLRDALLRAELS